MKSLNSRKKRHNRLRNKISGTSSRPRAAVFRSNKYIQIQLIDDVSRKTLLGMSTKGLKAKSTKTEQASELGKKFAKSIISDIKLSEVVFDRGGYQYHGRVKALADAMRESGLKF